MLVSDAKPKFEGAYERETGNVIAETFRHLAPLEMPGVLVHGHMR